MSGRILSGGALVISTLFALPAQAQSTTFPDSPLGRCGAALIAAVNGRDTSDLGRFVREHVSTDALKEIATVPRIEWLARVQQQSGGLDVRSSEEQGGVLETVCTTRTGGRWIRIYAFADDLEPARLREYGVILLRDPAVEADDLWPTRRMSEADAVAEIGLRMSAAAARDEFSGSVLVAKGDRVIFHEACGMADQNWRVPNGRETRFNLASTGKMFTAVVIAQLVEQGSLSFTDTLARVLPDYPNLESARKITIAHLLSHSAGLGILFDRPGFDRRKRYRRSMDYLPLFAHAPLLFEPGSRSAYSNEGYVVLGAVIERITGQNYFDAARERVFKPAGMTSTGYFAIDDVVHDMATGYTRFEDDPLGMDARRPNWIFLQWKGSAAGGGYSSAGDLLRFAQALRSGKLISPGMLTTLLTPHAAGGWYGYGVELAESGGKEVLGHGGGGPGSGISADLRWFADGSYTAVVLSNFDMPGAGEFQQKLMAFLAAQ